MTTSVLAIERLDSQGRGIAFCNGKVCFVEGALPEEEVRVDIMQEKKQFSVGCVREIVKASPHRITPACEYADRCGGCALQHLKSREQLLEKTQIWCEQIKRIGKMTPPELLPAIVGDAFAYRRRTRLAYDWQTDSLGFRGKGTNQIIDIEQCLTLTPELSCVLPSLKNLLHTWGAKVTTVQLVAGERTCALSLDVQGKWAYDPLLTWHATHAAQWQIWVNQKCVIGQKEDLFYTIDDERIIFSPYDFIQVNAWVNQQLVAQALDYLGDVQGKHIIDFFAGLGNFSRLLIKRGAQILALEGEKAMVKRLQESVSHPNYQALQANLFSVDKASAKRFLKADMWLLDPPRAGAKELLSILNNASYLPEKIVYISCDSATFARDARILQEAGYEWRSARLAQMFAQTAHIESIALFERKE